jgi:hypothetical protein
MKNLPKTFNGLVRALGKSQGWDEAQRPDGVRELFIQSDRHKRAVITYEHEALWVNLYYDTNSLYDFEFSRLREDWPRWSWSRQINDKNWKEPAHMDLLRKLELRFK